MTEENRQPLQQFQTGNVSPDGQWRWNGQQWAPNAPQSPHPQQFQSGGMSPDGRWKWEGQQWVPNAQPVQQQPQRSPNNQPSSATPAVPQMWNGPPRVPSTVPTQPNKDAGRDVLLATAVGLVVLLSVASVFLGPVWLILAPLGGYAAYRIARYWRKERYFASEQFLAHKNQIASFVAEHNELAHYISEIRSRGTFEVGASSTGVHAHLASSDNTSQWNYRRDRNVANFIAPNVHNCSLQLVRNANADPIKYVMKYFGIKAEETDLRDTESLGDSITRLENAIGNLQQRESSITQTVSPPKFIIKHYSAEFMAQVGVDLSPITVPYPVYIFEYVSAGGNSSQRTTVTLNTPTIDAMVETLSQKIRWKNSAAGQRALMTSRLRTFIKDRDDYTCQQCSVALSEQPHLLLEVDHIMPVSRGGLSTPDNLQTLCWRCNRTKSNRVA
jgi:hypothetical protein